MEVGESLVRGRSDAVAQLPEEARTLAQKVAQRPYTVLQKDIDDLRAAGWTDNAVFELVVAVAVGSGCGVVSAASRIREGS